MNKNLNRRNIFLLSRKKLIYISIFFFIIIIALFTYIQKNYIINNFTFAISNFSQNFEYQYINLKVQGLNKVEYKYLENKLKKYFKTSIFLLPLESITDDIKDNNWIKNVKLTTNYKDTIFIKLEEYEPLGIYTFNNKLFYFDRNGKIIDEIDKSNFNDKNLIIFSGKYSNLEAKFIIDILENLNFTDFHKIKRIDYIQKRRWDIILNNNTKLMLSETNPNKSLLNFMNIKKNLSKNNFNNIKYFDLRNLNKSLISYY